MPANKKYLTKSPWLRLAKILAGVVGGYTVMFSFHMLLTKLFPSENVIVTSFFTGYILWAILLLVAFLVRNVWKVWAAYAILTLLFLLPYLIS
ncbi:hypothetical protein KK062_03445 [Fulvivirgaceae bacterium PWU5]|uniref:Iron uptake protein n=1 Tax=Dawidia cretensis TaxID=2782350 RepID=A0AAP2DW51_9BACT|nr:hypothetical protein [Dawidia cretensis]